MKPIFLSYRRLDSGVFTGRLYDRLTAWFGQNAVFLDIDTLPAAVDFREAIADYVRRSGVVVAVIGDRWLGSGEHGRRIDESEDPVRIEIEAALASGRPVLPLYVGEHCVLHQEELPASIRRLPRLNALIVDPGADFDHHVRAVLRELESILLPSRFARAGHRLRRHLYRHRQTYGAALATIATVAATRDFVAMSLISEDGLRRSLESLDPASFSHAPAALYEVARALPDRKSLVAETDLVESIRMSTTSIDVFAVTGTAFYNNQEALTDALGRGARLRLILLDHSPANRDQVTAYFRRTGEAPDDLDDVIRLSASNASQARGTLIRFRNRMAIDGRVELRWWRGPFLNSFWIRDGRSPHNGLAHIEVSFHGDASRNPSVRFGRLSPRMVGVLQQQFDEMWERSIRDEDR